MSVDARVALLGLGPMGAPIAGHLVDASVPLTVWNRTISKTEALRGRGARVSESPASAAAPVVLTVLPDLPQVESVTYGADGLVQGWREARIAHPILVIHGTTAPDATAHFARRLGEEEGVIVIDAPLSGGVSGAAAGTLSIMIGGDAAAVSSVEPILRHYGRVITHFGPPGSGALAKACNQIVVAGTVAAISESLALAERAGLDKTALIDILEGGLAASEVLRQKKAKWISDDYTPGGSAVNQLKDLRFVENSARSRGIELPMTRAVKELFEVMITRGDGDLDHTGVIKVVRNRGGSTA